MKKISKNISSNMMNKMRLQQVKASLSKITAVMVVTMTVLAQSLIAEAQEAEPDKHSFFHKFSSLFGNQAPSRPT